MTDMNMARNVVAYEIGSKKFKFFRSRKTLNFTVCPTRNDSWIRRQKWSIIVLARRLGETEIVFVSEFQMYGSPKYFESWTNLPNFW